MSTPAEEAIPKLTYTVKEAAEALGISESTVRWMVYRNEIPHRRVHGRGTKGQGKILIPKAALEQWLMGATPRQETGELPAGVVSIAHRNKRSGRVKGVQTYGKGGMIGARGYSAKGGQKPSAPK